METGFDGWLLKPVDFKRLQLLIQGIEDEELRKQEKYTPGKWGIGGWFIRDSGETSDGGGSKVHYASLGKRVSIMPGGWPEPELDGGHSRDDIVECYWDEDKCRPVLLQEDVLSEFSRFGSGFWGGIRVFFEFWLGVRGWTHP